MAQPLSEIQKAVVTAFRADSALQAALVGSTAPKWSVYDFVPSSTTTNFAALFPYIYVGDMQGRIGSGLAMGKKATDILLTLHIFSTYVGWFEAQNIETAVDNILNEKNLTLANGYSWFYCLFDNSIPLIDSTTQMPIRHLAVRYRIMTQGG